MNKKDIGELTKESYIKIENYMKKIDEDSKKIEDQYLIKPNFRIHQSKHFNNPNKKYAYATSVFINESYIPSALVLGKNLRLLNHKYPCVCMVQDKSYKTDDKQIFQGVSQKAIEDLLELYDYVIGVDLLKVNNYVQSPYHFTNTYTNILYYVTKGQVLGLNMFEKVMYLDASSYIENNIDNVFVTYDKGTFLEDPEFRYSKVGIHGAFFMVTPNKYYYHKHMLYVQNYKKYFSDLYFMRGVDELLIFYAVFPNWCNKLFNDHFACRKNYKRPNEGCDIYHFQHEKPFKNPNNNSNNLMENIKKHYIYYDDWDRLVKLLLKSHPHLGFYFNHIKGFRETQF
jgi:hypothetical protein